MDDLRRLAAEYSRVQMGIELKNREVQAERERRKGIELEIVDLMKTPEFATVHNFQHQGATFKVDPPGTWKSSWYLSKSELRSDIVSYWSSTTDNRNAQECFNHIVAKTEARSRDTDWRINWTYRQD